MPLTSVNEIKIICGISGSLYDQQISTLLPVVESYIQEATACTFDTGSAYPDGLKLAAGHMITYLLYKTKNSNISSETVGGYSVSFNNQYPDDINEMLRPFRKVKFT